MAGSHKQATVAARRANVADGRYVRLFIVCAMALTVFGCSKDMSDLQAYVQEVKARPAIPPKPPAALKPYESFEYVAAGRRDPFDSSVIETPEEVARKRGSTSDIKPPINHTPEFLESFPLDTLRMVGSLERGGVLWGLIKTPDHTIQRVSQGHFIGQNYGQITQVTETGISLSETVPDGFGGWQKREGAVALSE